MKKRMRIAVTGAAGQIGYALLFRIAAGEMLGKETEISLSLLEIEKALPALKGVVMELEDGAFPLLKEIRVSSKPEEAFEGVDGALLIGSIPRKAGMARSELLEINGKIFVEQGKALDKVAQKDCRILVVGNPCNTNAYIAKSVARRIAPENFFAMTMLDQHRAVAQLAKKAAVDVTAVKNLSIWGNHSSTMFPDFYHARINGRPTLEVLPDEGWLQGPFIQTVQQRGAAIIQARGLSSAASAAQAAIETLRRLSVPSANKEERFSVAVSSDGSYGVEKGLVFSFPVVFDGLKWRIVQGISHNSFAEKKIQETQEELLKEKEAISRLV